MNDWRISMILGEVADFPRVAALQKRRKKAKKQKLGPPPLALKYQALEREVRALFQDGVQEGRRQVQAELRELIGLKVTESQQLYVDPA